MVLWKQTPTGKYCPIDNTEIYVVESRGDIDPMCLYCRCDWKNINLDEIDKVKETARVYLTRDIPKQILEIRNRIKSIGDLEIKLSKLELILREGLLKLN